MSDLAVLLAVLVLVPAAFMVPIKRVGRIVFFVLGLIFAFGIGFLMELGGPDSPGLAIPFFGVALSLAALLGEAGAWAWEILKRKRVAHG